jgi:hypothetical protein
MNKFIIMLVLLFSTSAVFAQNEMVGCKNRIVNDTEKRDFADKNPIKIDVDGDGKLDSITARTYTLKVGNKSSKVKETHWIAFDLKTAKGKTLKSFFKYKYGDNRADYWIYAMLPCSADKDAKTDLLFYTGDDTSDETIILRNAGNSFKVVSRKVKKN